LTAPTFVTLHQAGGLAPQCIQRLLVDGAPPALLVDALLVVSQLARVHREDFNTYDPIAKARQRMPDRCYALHVYCVWQPQL
jgi:hypothetical protein